jgi:hypothetical protein
MSYHSSGPVTCLGLHPCENPDSDAAQVNGRQKRYRGNAKIDKATRKKGSVEAERLLEQVYALPEADKRFLYVSCQARGSYLSEVREAV